jgi:hypothetical protein
VRLHLLERVLLDAEIGDQPADVALAVAEVGDRQFRDTAPAGLGRGVEVCRRQGIKSAEKPPAGSRRSIQPRST